VCSAAGCKYFDVDSKRFASGLQMDEVLVLTRTTNTVRAVEIQSGVEKYVPVHLLLTGSFLYITTTGQRILTKGCIACCAIIAD